MKFQEVVEKDVTGYVRYKYSTMTKNIRNLYENLKSVTGPYLFNLRDNEIEVYSQGYFVGRILDNGTSYLVSEKVLKEPAIAYLVMSQKRG